MNRFVDVRTDKEYTPQPIWNEAATSSGNEYSISLTSMVTLKPDPPLAKIGPDSLEYLIAIREAGTKTVNVEQGIRKYPLTSGLREGVLKTSYE